MQTPPPLEYERARSVEDAIAALQRLGPSARVIAGGHSLLPMMKLRLASPEHLIDINDLRELSYIRIDGEDVVAIGALTRHAELLESELLARLFPAFGDAELVSPTRWCATGGRSAARCARRTPPRTSRPCARR